MSSSRITATELEDLVAAGRRDHPELTVTERVIAFVGERAVDLRPDARAARAGDLMLAGACAVADPVAIRMIRECHLPQVRPALVQLGIAPEQLAEIEHRVVIALVVAAGGAPPGIAGYRGRGALRAYVRAVAINLALKMLTRGDEARAVPAEVEALALDAEPSAESSFLGADSRAVVKAAFEGAMARLSPRQRLLLRQHYLDGLTIDVLAELHGVHRATTARWLEGARRVLLRGMRRSFAETQGIDPARLDSLVDLVGSQLDLSMARLLGSSGAQSSSEGH
jgi:RNA polymerase sigma-70 factor (ECF subfamily)